MKKIFSVLLVISQFAFSQNQFEEDFINFANNLVAKQITLENINNLKKDFNHKYQYTVEKINVGSNEWFLKYPKDLRDPRDIRSYTDIQAEEISFISTYGDMTYTEIRGHSCLFLGEYRYEGKTAV